MIKKPIINVNLKEVVVNGGNNIKCRRMAMVDNVPHFEPDSDGLTFHLSPVFTDRLHRFVTNDHAKTIISRICGPVEKLNDTTFRVQFYRMGLMGLMLFYRTVPLNWASAPNYPEN